MKIKVIKDIYLVHCTPTIFVPIKDDEVTFKEDFHLITTIKHTGNLNRGHYTWFIMILNLESWFHCNDTAVPKTIFHLIITSTNQINFFCISYCELEYLSLSSCVMTRHVNPVFVHFFSLFCKEAWISYHVFRCNDPTYNASYVNLYGKDATAFLVVRAQSLTCLQLWT